MHYLKEPLKYISQEAERADIETLIHKIKEDKWMDSDTIIVTIQPEYSANIAQVLNHKMCYLNKNELYDSATLLLPSVSMNQIWNIDTWEYELWDKYATSWIQRCIKKSNKYLFVFCGKDRARQLNTLKVLIRDKADVRFAFLYLHQDSTFTPDYFVEKYDSKLIFSWENYDNPNTWKAFGTSSQTT